MAFSWGFIIVKSLPYPAAVVGFYRLALGAGVLSTVALIWRVPWPRARGPLIGAGLAFGAHQLLFIAATQRTAIAIVTLIGATQPLLVALISRRTLGERVSRAVYACAVLAVAGVGLVVAGSAGDDSRTLLGDLFAVANVLVFTSYFLLAKRARLSGAPTLTFTAGFLAIALLPVGIAMLLVGPVMPNAPSLALLLLLAMGPGNGHLLINWAHARVSAALSSIVLALVPVLASIWAHLVLGEPYTWYHAAGMSLTLVAIEVGRRAERRSRSAPTSLAGATSASTRAPLAPPEAQKPPRES